MRCVIIGEQDAHLRRCGRYFKELGWQVTLAPSSNSLVQHADAAIDLAILKADIEDDTLQADIAAVRRASSDCIIFMAGDFSLAARVRALSLDANEFIPPEIPLDLLQARVTALLRLRRERFDPIHRIDDLVVDVLHRRVHEGGREIHLSHMEFQLLLVLVKRSGETVTRSELIEKLWADAARAEDNTLESHISRLRHKFHIGGHRRIVTVRGIGYRLEAPQTVAQ